MPKKEYNLKEDHIVIKKQIKEWEHTIDKVIIQLLHQRHENEIDRDVLKECGDILEEMTHAMCVINM